MVKILKSQFKIPTQLLVLKVFKNVQRVIDLYGDWDIWQIKVRSEFSEFSESWQYPEMVLLEEVYITQASNKYMSIHSNRMCITLTISG